MTCKSFMGRLSCLALLCVVGPRDACPGPARVEFGQSFLMFPEGRMETLSSQQEYMTSWLQGPKLHLLLGTAIIIKAIRIKS